MKRCEHPLKTRAYGTVLMGFFHREVELCRKCRRFRLIQDPLRGWLVLTAKSLFEAHDAFVAKQMV